MKRLLTLILLVCAFNAVQAQSRTGGKNFYVNSTSTALFDTTSTSSNLLVVLKKHDNVVLLDSVNNQWGKFRYKDKVGYTLLTDFKPGKVVISSYSYRTGARCKDGTSSSATGRGACSHHGGVSYWLTSTRESVRIVNN
ncbi:hypothetical protein [Gracilimonas sp.]|uniref:hypothetical protein n=1 Tax=Gracilimonas sp. TaxID=1974203 RepID=UPI003BABB076